MKSKKSTIGAYMIVGSLIALIAIAIYSVILSFKYPDMTNVRRMMEFPEIFWMTLPCMVVFFIGRYLFEYK